jgi:hypothetical protein
MAKKNNYENTIPWKMLENYLLLQRHEAFMTGLKAEGLQAVGISQGRALMCNDLLNLPETLRMQEMEIEELNQE